uniref:zinc finger protein 804A n=1 Tax=Euleptes europaea TaxID=460621 RepID=UPI0025408C6A|nr:zinc finger protein 804A [Euleptes europaea]
MECYYIVISSAHLRNGHFRNIKGVFRGPLSKNGNKTLDYAEKENTIAKALEDLKANFYCELCDKQYYKHQEFDNHINSYDHAHKQRLKELKQREFARNVASKSRKDERKQEKALQRLHKLAELRKEAACAPGSGPMFRSTTVTVRDHCNEILVDSAKKEQEFDFAYLHKSKAPGDVTSVAASTPEAAKNSKQDANKLGDQMLGLHGQKVGFSFAFPKKASVKLESSAAAFYDYNDETSAEHGLSRRSRFVPGLSVSSAEESILNAEENPNSVAPLMEKHNEKTEPTPLQDSKEPSVEENAVQEATELRSPISHSKEPEPSSLESFCVNVDSTALPDETSRDALGSQALPAENNSDEHIGNKCTGLPVNEACFSQQETQEGNDQNISSDSLAAEDEIKKSLSDGPIPGYPEEETIALPCKQDSHKRSCEPFVPVLNKHGSTILQWPSEMLIYTSTEPSISYSCNPLCFDFRSSRASESLEKNKPQTNMPNSPHKTDSSQGSVRDYMHKSHLVHADSVTDTNAHPCNHATPIPMDVSSAGGWNSGKSQDELSLDAFCETEEKEKHHSLPKELQEDSSTDEQQSKKWIKRTHEKCSHKTRKRKRRRKLCYHHHQATTKVDTGISPAPEEQNNCLDAKKHQHLPGPMEQGMGETGLEETVAEMSEQSHESPGTENSDNCETISMSSQDHGNQSPHPAWNAKDNRDYCINSKNLCRRSKPVSHRQSNKPGLNSERCSSVCSRSLCSWSSKRSSSSPYHKHLGHYPDEKCTNHTQPIKRAYNSLTDEPDFFRQKRRHHTHSFSSDESSNAQTWLSEENVPHTYSCRASCKQKRKRRRKRTRTHHPFIERLPRKNISVQPPKGVSLFNNTSNISTEDTTEKKNLPFRTDYANSTEETIQPIECQPAPQPEQLLPLENSQGSNCSVTRSTQYLEESTCSTSPVIKQSALAATNSTNVLEEAEKHENVSVPGSQPPQKVPSIERSLDQPSPKSYLCHYEVAETIPPEKRHPSANEWLLYNPGIFNSPPPLPFKEAHINSHAFLANEQILTPFALPEHALLLPPENHDKFKDLQCEAYHQIFQQNILANKMKLSFPPAAFPPSNPPLQPLPLQQPLCSTSVTTIHHTVLQQHAAAAAAAAASTFKVLQPHQQFLSQVPTLSRAPLPHLSVGPRLCPAGHTTIIGPPQLPFIPASVLHPNHLAFPPLPHALFPSLLSPHPAVIPLQPLF